MDNFFYIECYVYHNQQIWAKLVGLRARHPLRFTSRCCARVLPPGRYF